MVKTTTTQIHQTEEGIIINEFFGRSALKKAYLYEQANTINHLGKGNSFPLLLDLSCISVSIDELSKLVQEEKNNQVRSLAVVVASKPKQYILNLWFKIRKLHFPVAFFTEQKEAKAWLKAYC